MTALRPAALAFDAIAAAFDERFGAWNSVAAQRRAVRSALLMAFPEHGRILEIGGGTGADAMFLAQRGLEVFLTDPSPAMVAVAEKKLRPLGGKAALAAAEEMDSFAEEYFATDGRLFDGCFSNFAALNCVADVRPLAGNLARLLKPGAPAALVFFGTFCPGEMITEVLRGRPRFALRRCWRREAPARLAGREFRVIYHRRADLIREFSPWFTLEGRLGIGVTVPPSAAEPWISEHPHLLAAMESLDHQLARPLAALADHVLYSFRRTDAPSRLADSPFH